MNTRQPYQDISFISLDLLIPYARNTRTHTGEQVSQIAASIREFGFINPVLVKKDLTIIAGHGRVRAAQHLNMQEVPCLILDHLTDVQAKALAIADNKIPLNAGWDVEMLNLEMDELKLSGADLSLLAFNDEELKSLIDGLVKEEISSEEAYTSKIIAPIYEPKGEQPLVTQLFDNVKTQQLVDEIDKCELSPEIANFLRLAAQRHTSFNFRNIAEFYSHADQNIQRLFEQSALVIIDFDAAIENGFVHLTERLAELAAREEEEEGTA